MKKIILASSSPRRKDLLEQLGLNFEVDASNIAEKLDTAMTPHQLAGTLSLHKARAVAHKYKDALIIAADTFGLLDG
jgi:septum formation protein